MKINITDDAIDHLNMLQIKNIEIVFHGQGCGGPVFSMVEGKPNIDDFVIKVKDVTFSFKKELIKYESIDINYSNSLDEGFTVEAENCGGCIRCNGCWLNTIKTKF